MSSHGKVLDLLDDRYLNLQDVAGNVEPFPKLVPYEEYGGAMLVYRMDTKHEIFMALVQDFTDRIARHLGKELWTWFVQWEVEEAASSEIGAPPTPKKPRLALQEPGASQPPNRKPPAYTICERRCLDREVIQEESTLRILIDIVQVESKLVPNWIEFLYQWIDYMEGDGKALKAALRKEIPSLWDFEYHPFPIERMPEPGQADGSGGEDKTTGTDKLDVTAKKLGTKVTRKKPDLRLLETMTEESERMQYREVKFGMQPPTDPNDEPLPPLVNVPRDDDKRRKYYAACFKNRQRAYWLLQEVGITTKQIANYRRMQVEPPRDTPEYGHGLGFLNYYKDQPYAMEQYMMNEEMARLREKQKEIALSNRLALEAQVAAQTASAANGMAMPGNGSSAHHTVPPPLIPPTTTYPGRPDVAANILARMRAMTQHRQNSIRLVPSPLLGKLKSKLFVHAADRIPLGNLRPLPQFPQLPFNNEESDSESGEDDEDDEDEDYSDGMDEDEEDDNADQVGVTQTGPVPTAPPPPPAAPVAPNIPAFMQSLNRTQLSSLMPLLNSGARQAVLNRVPSLNANPTPAQSGQLAGMNGGSTAAIYPAASLPQPVRPQPSLAINIATAASQGLNTGSILPTAPPGITISLAPPTTQQNVLGSGPIQRTRLQQLIAAQGSPHAPQSTTILPTLASISVLQPSNRAQPPPSLNLQRLSPGTSTGLPSVQRNASSPVPMTPLANLAGNLSIASPQAASPHGIPIHIYVPKIIVHPVLGRGKETDALVLGYTRLGTGTLVLSKAIFLPADVWENTQNRVRKGHFEILETYAPPASHPARPKPPFGVREEDTREGTADLSSPHKSLYEKLQQAYGFMVGCQDREEELTKRWRTTMGPLTEKDRGAVWEGWGVVVDKAIEMTREERKGAFRFASVDGPVRTEEQERRMREFEEMIAEEEAEEEAKEKAEEEAKEKAEEEAKEKAEEEAKEEAKEEAEEEEESDEDEDGNEDRMEE